MHRLIKTLAFSSILSVVLLYIRIQWSGTLFYVFLVWNLFLAWIPFVISLLLLDAKENGRKKYFSVVLFCVWLLFFPNSPYILTDLFHLKLRNDIPLWFDLVLILTFAWNGLVLGFASLLNVQKFLSSYLSKNKVTFLIVCLFVLCGFGVYLGRYPRFNSWDIVTNPIQLFSNIFYMITHPLQHTRMVGVTFFFSLFLVVCYQTLSSLIHHHKNDSRNE